MSSTMLYFLTRNQNLCYHNQENYLSPIDDEICYKIINLHLILHKKAFY